MKKTIVWATDGSHAAERALESARRLGVLFDARIVVTHVDERFSGRAAGLPVLADEHDRRREVEDRVAELRAEGYDVELLVPRTERDPAGVVIDVASATDADLIVCGTRQAGVLSGSFARRVLRHAPCPVLAVCGGDGALETNVAHLEGAHA